MKLIENRIESHHLGQTYKLWIPENPGGSSGRLCVFLDGELYLERVGAIPVFTDLQTKGQIPPLAAVFVSYGELESRHHDYICSHRYNRFLIEELLPWMRENGPHGVDDGGHLIGGLSLSGLAAAYAAIEHPDVFPLALCQSPSAWWNKQWICDHVEHAAPPSARFWISVGRGETETDVRHSPTGMHQEISQLDSCRALARALTGQSIANKLSEFDGGHDMECWGADLPHGLEWLLSDR